LMRRVLLRTISLKEGTMTSKPVFLTDLDFQQPDLLKTVLDALHNAHLIRFSTPEIENTVQQKYQLENPDAAIASDEVSKTAVYLEPTHYDLICEWQRLRHWNLELKIENLLLSDKVAIATSDYLKNKQLKKYLWQTDPRLDLGIQMVAQQPILAPLNQLEQRFIKKSQQVRRQNTLVLRGSVLTAFVLLSFLTLWAFKERFQAKKETRIAQNVALGMSQTATDPTLAARLLEYTYRKHPNNRTAMLQYFKTLNDYTLTFYTKNFTNDPSKYVLTALSADGQTILMYQDSTATVWNAQTGKLVTQWITKVGHLTQILLTADGKHIFVRCADSQVQLRDAFTGDILRTFKTQSNKDYLMQLSEDEKLLLIKFERNTVLLDVQTNQILRQYLNMDIVKMSADGKIIVTKNNQQVIVRDIATDKVKQKFISENGEIMLTITLSKDAKTALLAFKYGVEVWNTETATKIHTIHAHLTDIHIIELEAGKDDVMIASIEGMVKYWNLRTGEVIQSLLRENNINEYVNLSIGKKQVLMYDGYHSKLSEFQRDFLMQTDEGDIRTIPSSLNEKNVLKCSRSKDTIIGILWDEKNAKITRRFDWIQESDVFDKVTSALSADGKLVFISTANEMRLWDAYSGHLIRKDSVEEVSNAAFSADGRVLGLLTRQGVALCIDKHPISYKRSGNRLLRQTVIALNSDGSKILCGSETDERGETGEVQLLDAQTGTVLRSFTMPQSVINAVAFSLDEKSVWATSREGVIKQWCIELDCDGKSFAMPMTDKELEAKGLQLEPKETFLTKILNWLN
jgi:WD40 repeat protein